MFYLYERLYPTKQMVESREYFKKNQERVDKIIEFLEDEKSKNVYKEMIDFRQYRKKFPQYSEEDIYFVKDIIKLDDDAILVDCGAYTGDTIERFINNHKKYGWIYALEPDKANCSKLIQKIAKNQWRNITVCECASWSSETTLKFTDNSVSSTGNRIANDGNISIEANSIDNILKNGKGCSLIKMDVEGAELESLKGAQNTILQYRPQLAICIYHSDEDMISIAEYIHALVPDYKIYVRHHTCNLSDMVLYAIPSR